MADLLHPELWRVADDNNAPAPGAKAYFYDTGTTTLRTVYADEALTTPHPSPLVADSAGVFAAVYATGTTNVKAVVTKADDSALYTVDPCIKMATALAAASLVAFTPSTRIAATDVQAAIELVDNKFADYGLGITGAAPLLANLDATTIPSGIYRFDGTTTGTFPTGAVAADGGVVVMLRMGAAQGRMILHHATSLRAYNRRMVSSTWQAWREEINVDQGAAQGDIIERGATAWGRVGIGTPYYSRRVNAAGTGWEYGEPPLGVGQTWQDVKASRAVNTWYQNLTGRTIFVNIVWVNGTAVQYAQVSQDGITGVDVASSSAAASGASAAFPVPADDYYRVTQTAGTTTVVKWAELRS